MMLAVAQALSYKSEEPRCFRSPAPLTLCRFWSSTMAEQDLDRVVIIYKVTHIESERLYFGITKRTLERRKAEHLKQAMSGKTNRLHRAIKRYGAEAFKFEVVTTAVNDREACAIERGLIAQAGSMNRALGFNQSTGGEMGNGVARGQSTKDNLRAIANKQWADPEAREAARQTKLGWKPPEQHLEHLRALAAAQKGVPITDEVRARMSAAQIGHETSQETRAKIGAKSKGRTWSIERRLAHAAAVRARWAEGSFANRDKKSAETRASKKRNLLLKEEDK